MMNKKKLENEKLLVEREEGSLVLKYLVEKSGKGRRKRNIEMVRRIILKIRKMAILLC